MTVRWTTGTDIVAVGRITALAEARGDRFLERWFTPAELGYCAGKAVPGRHLAARFAAKEAVLKALPATWDGPLPWRSIEIAPAAGGAPVVHLSGELAEVARRVGVRHVQVSLSHCDEYATAVALVEVVEPEGQRGA
jgi:holo-[acyl-carrier protein] synthase